jgi:hypothetical protein
VPANLSGAIILIDSGPIREQAVQSHGNALKEIARAESVLDRFNQEDKPAFRQWLHATFGNELTTLREIAETHAKNQMFLGAVLEQIMFHGLPPWKAIARVRARQAGERHPDDPEEDFQDKPHSHDEDDAAEPQDFSSWEDIFDGSPPDIEHEFRQDFAKYATARPHEKAWIREAWDTFMGVVESVGGIDLPPFEAAYEFYRRRFGGAEESQDETGHRRRSARSEGRKPSKNKPDPINDPLRSLFRDIAKRLHPDAAGKMSPVAEELWHEAQAAYQEKDIERLRSILARVQTQLEHHSIATLPVGRILALIDSLKKSARLLGNEIRRSKKDIAWRFSVATAAERVPIKKRIARDLASEMAELRTAVTRTEAAIQDFERPMKGTASRRKPRAGGRRRS